MISPNGKTTLERLSACDKYLWRGEQLVMWRFVVCVVLPLLLSIGRIWLARSIFYCNVQILYCAAASIAWVLFETRIVRNRRTAARMLQLAECDLYGIRWNKYLCGEEPLPEDVSLNMRLDVDKYKNYYPESQAENDGFMQNLRSINARYKSTKELHLKLCRWIMGVFVALIVLASALVYKVNFNGFLFYAVLPCVPVLIWFQAVAVSYKRSDAQLGLASTVEFQELNENSKGMIQDCVYMYRVNTCVVPRQLIKKVERK